MFKYYSVFLSVLLYNKYANYIGLRVWTFMVLLAGFNECKKGLNREQRVDLFYLYYVLYGTIGCANWCWECENLWSFLLASMSVKKGFNQELGLDLFYLHYVLYNMLCKLVLRV
jgi:hypothetical protein